MTPTPTARQQRDRAKAQVLVRVPDELLAWLRLYAASRRQSQALVIRTALEEFQAAHSS